MARRYGKRKNYGKRRKDPFYRFNKGDSVAIKALKMAANVKKALNVEYKATLVDTVLNNCSNSPTIANGEIFLLNGLAEGDGPSSRDGRQVEFKGINIHAWIASNTAGATGLPQICRFILFKWKGANGLTPTASDVLDATAGPYSLAFYNLDNVPQNIQILQDKRIDFNPNDKAFQSLTLRYNDHDIKTRYQGSTANASDVSTNAVYMMVLCDHISGTTGPNIRVLSRLRYVDN